MNGAIGERRLVCPAGTVLRRWRAAFLGAAIALLCLSAATRGSFSPIGGPGNHEDGQGLILGHVYGGVFSKLGVDYSNGNVTAHRIDDALASNGVLGLIDGAPGVAADQVWHDGFTSALATARFAALSQSFGFFTGTSGGSYTNLFDVSGSGYAVSGSATLADMRGLTWRWGRTGGGTGPHSSLITSNADGLDHLVSYRIDGLTDGYTTWMLFWEDRNILPGQPASDHDYNDLVIELKASAGTPTVLAPEPAGVALAWTALACLRRRRRVP